MVCVCAFANVIESLCKPRAMLEEATRRLLPLETGEFIAQQSHDVSISTNGVHAVAELLIDSLSEGNFNLSSWRDQNILHPREANESAVNWVFVVDTLNFSFWSESEEQKYLVHYGGQVHGGYWALCAAINRALDEGIPITSAAYYSQMSLDELAYVLRSDSDTAIPLLRERHGALTESGSVLQQHYNGSFLSCLRKSERSAQRLLHLIITGFSSFRDEGIFQGQPVSFYKRAQILVADLWGCFQGQGDAAFVDIDSITMFADYRVPQALAYLGALKYSDGLLKKLKEGVNFSSGDTEEMEIRGCSIWCVELISKHVGTLLANKGTDSLKQNAVLVDYWLWSYARGHRKELAGIPFHRVRCIYY
uniref:queuosine 5'-phosphate N-glycosylase/hydrolase isoform X2 n=1 Tax=Myxine glutinosa TaxID=7769 RepID=UPI00358F4353